MGMGKELFGNFPLARGVFEEADQTLGWKVSQLCFQGPADKLTQTANVQPTLLTVSMACYRLATERGLSPSMVAGHSLGEYTALVAAGAIEFSQALRLVRRRGELMEASGSQRAGSMAAILGADREMAERACTEAAQCGIVVMANFNCPGQVVISGQPEAVKRAGELAKEMGAKAVIPLQVSGAFHSPLMEQAAEEFVQELAKVEIGDVEIPVVSNATARPSRNASQLKEALEQQMTSPVLWEESVRRMIEEGVDTFIEVGPGKVLSGLVRRTDPSVAIFNIQDSESLESTVKALQ